MRTLTFAALSAGVLLIVGCQTPQQIAVKRCGAKPDLAAAMRAATATGDIDGAAAVKRQIDAYYGCLDREEMRAEAENAEAASALQELGNSLQSVGDDMRATAGAYGAAAAAIAASPPPMPPANPGLGTQLGDMYAVNHGDIHLGSPSGPVIGQTTRIGSPAPDIVMPPPPVVFSPIQ
jgi:hypothetical protein